MKSQPLGTAKFPDSYNVVRTVTLNKTDLTGGNNKYYTIEGHESKDGKFFRLYSRYGRVGHTGTEEERIPPVQDITNLNIAFEHLKNEKIRKKGYVEVLVAQSKMGSSVGNTQIISTDIKQDKVQTGKKGTTLKLHNSVVALVDRLYGEAGQAVRNQLSGSLNTTIENPLGTLTQSQIKLGRNILQEVQTLLTQKPKLQDSIHSDLIMLSNKFYSAIPQTMALRPISKMGQAAMDTWLKKMALNNSKILDEKEDLLDLLEDVQGLVNGFTSTDVEKKYTEIGCEYEYLEPTDERRVKAEKYVLSTRSSAHDWKCQIKNVWKIKVKEQTEDYSKYMKEVGNIKSLFHGSGPQNILGICKRGLLMRPPGVYVTGSMFGNGLYFADQSSKSEQYAFGRYSGFGGKGDTYFMFLADVALGKVMEYTTPQSNLSKAPNGYHSVMGKKGNYLYHNEFIIYEVKQHVLEYLIEFKTGR